MKLFLEYNRLRNSAGCPQGPATGAKKEARTLLQDRASNAAPK
jgi:hypothetical protein